MRSLTAVAAVVLAACGQGAKSPADGGAPVDPLAFFALAKGSCWEYSNGAAVTTPPKLGIAVEESDVAGTPAPSFLVRARVNGQLVRTWLLSVAGQELMLTSLEIRSGGSRIDWTYQPAVKLDSVKHDVAVPPTFRVETASAVAKWVNGVKALEDPAGAVKVDVGAFEQLVAPVGTVRAHPLLIQTLSGGQAQLVDRIWLAPRQGWAKVELDGDATAYVLQRVKTLGAGEVCGFQ